MKVAAPESASAGWTLEFVAKATLIVIALWALATGIWMARDILFITFFALLVASFLSIFVEPLHRRGVSRALAAPAVLFGFLLLLLVLFLLVWPTLGDQLGVIQKQLPAAIDDIQNWLS